MSGVTHSVVPHDELLFKIREASGQVPQTSQSDIAGTLRKTLSSDGPSPAIIVGDDIHWRIILTDARSQNVALIDPFGSGFLQDVIAAIKHLTTMNNQGGGSTKSGLQDCNRRETRGTVAYGQYGYMRNGCSTGANTR